MIKLSLFLLLIVLASAFPLSAKEVLVYQVTLIHQNEPTIYNYTFIINSIQNNFVNFTVIITELEPNTSVLLNSTYVYPLNDLKVLPVNGNVFNGQNFTFVGFTQYKGQNASVYKGYFVINNLKIPSTAYFINGTLVYLNGSIQGYTLSVSLYQKYSLVPSSSSNAAYIIIGIIVAMIVIGVIALIKIGKI